MDTIDAQPRTRPAPPAHNARGEQLRRKLRVLCVLPGIPLPTDTGGLMRSLTQLRALDAHFDLTVLSLHKPPQDEEGLRRQLRGEVVTVPLRTASAESMAAELAAVAVGRPLFYARYAPPSLGRALDELLRRKPFDVVHFDHLHTAQLAPLVRKLQPQARVVLDEHNVEAQIVERMAPLARPHLRLPLKWQAKRLRKMESSIVRAVDAVLACSHLDATQFDGMGARLVKVVPNGTTFEPAPLSNPPPRRDVVYVGSFDWWPNIDAALVLAREIWPRCAGKLGEGRLMIVGRNPPPAVRALTGDRVVVTGGVPSVAPYLHGARIAAVPLRAGSGTRLKIIEAWAYGVPVVSTRLGAEGLPVRDGHNALLADSPAEFAEALARVAADPELAERLSKGALEAAAEFHPNRIGERLAAFYRELVPAPDAESLTD